MRSSLRAALAQVVSPGGLLPEEEASGWSFGGRTPEAVVAPASEEEAAGVLALATREGWRVRPAGFGGWLEGGGPGEADLVLSTRRLHGLAEYEPADLTFSARAGTPVKRLQSQFRERGQWLPLDPPGSAEGSWGALVALGVAGPLRAGFGTPRDHVLGLTLISGDGRILRWGGRVVKNVAGFDVTRLATGSWGSLGVITSVSARLFPLPAEDVTLLLTAPTAEDLLPAARTMVLSSLPVAAIELLDPLSGLEDTKAGLVLRLLGSLEQVKEMEGRIRADLAGNGGASDRGSHALIRLSGERSRAFHEMMERWEEDGGLVLRMALLPSQLEILLAEARGMAGLAGIGGGGGERWPRLSMHAGAGVLRALLPGALFRAPSGDTWIRTLQELRERLEGRGGSLGLSRGPAAVLREVGAWSPPGAERAILEGLRRQFDPQGVLAPGGFPS